MEIIVRDDCPKDKIFFIKEDNFYFKDDDKKEISKIEDLLSKAFSTFVEGEDNSWKCEHNLKVLIDTIKGLIFTKDL